VGVSPVPSHTIVAGVRGLAVLAFAEQLTSDPAMLLAWAHTFGSDDDVTLVIHAGGWDPEQVGIELRAALAQAGIDEEGEASPDLYALPGPIGDLGELEIAGRCAAVFARTPARPPFERLRRVDDLALAELRDLLPAGLLKLSPDSLDRVSAPLRAFVSECPNERQSILEFMLQVSSELEPGTRVLDIGAGEQPYRELFEHVEYVTSDWENSVHPGARCVDVVGPADDLPIADSSFEAILNTQVLEHVAEPAKVLGEMHRLLVPGGRVYITLPLAWELHEEPFDFYRYTRYGIAHLLRAAGFTDIDVRPRNDCFTTIAQLMRNTFGAMGRAADGLDERRVEAGRAMFQMADLVQSFAHLDTRWSLPLGYAIRARKKG
jgi:SAM-dependent methyltransferase